MVAWSVDPPGRSGATGLADEDGHYRGQGGATGRAGNQWRARETAHRMHRFAPDTGGVTGEVYSVGMWGVKI